MSAFVSKSVCIQIAGQFVFKYKEETSCWTHQLNKENYSGQATLV
jgi:hypothetical protein